MGATPSQYVEFKRSAADAARAHGEYANAGRVFIASREIRNPEGFAGNELVERGSTVYDAVGASATYLRATTVNTVAVLYYGEHYDSVLPASEFGLTITEH